MTVDDFLPNPDAALEHAATRDFGPAVGPDGRTYDGISFDVAPWVAEHLYCALHGWFGPVAPTYLFYRVTPAGARPPQWAHSDSPMGDLTALVYLTRNPPEGAGTAVLEHAETGLAREPRTEAELAVWTRDHSDQSRWRVRSFTPMRFNRLVILPSDLMHAAQPQGGFGDGPWNARLVLTTFFRKLGDKR